MSDPHSPPSLAEVIQDLGAIVEYLEMYEDGRRADKVSRVIKYLESLQSPGPEIETAIDDFAEKYREMDEGSQGPDAYEAAMARKAALTAISTSTEKAVAAERKGLALLAVGCGEHHWVHSYPCDECPRICKRGHLCIECDRLLREAVDSFAFGSRSPLPAGTET